MGVFIKFAVMTNEQKIIWERINRFELDEPGVGLPFSGRLSRENGWPLDFALRAIYEYKRFMFLVCVSPKPLTPSDAVDQVWHLHLLYTESYWGVFCPKILGRQIHHTPTEGGKSERSKFYDWYEFTLEFYRHTFDEVPPSDIWPTSARRFSEVNFRRVNLHRNWVIRKWW